MRFDLKQYQHTAITQLLRALGSARAEVAGGGNKQAVVFAAPTAAGKTIMLAGMIEESLFGGSHSAVAATLPDPEVSFLWLSDRPDLNEQSRRRLLEASEALTTDRLVLLDSNFDAPHFEGGHVYFLNYQKLREDALLNRLGNRRSHTLWETIAATQARQGAKLVVIIDEAHRGLNRSAAEDASARTIAGTFISGSTQIRIRDGQDEIPFPACDIVVGVSATPTRFDQFLAAQQDRVRRSVLVAPADVRGSGLIKESIELYGLAENEHSWTLLGTAAGRFVAIERAWADYCQTNMVPTIVRPAMLVQVQDGEGPDVSRTSLNDVLRVLCDAIPDLKPEQVAHCFSGQGNLAVGGDWTIQRAEPNDLAAATSIRVVLFKTALNTGWDCPRAEVMMSFRHVDDGTNIAQLVGRMLRTPLARSIPGNDALNATYLYLPHYDRAELVSIRNYLMAPDVQAGSNVELGDGLVDLDLRQGAERIFESLRLLPTQAVSSDNSMPSQRRAFRLARLLSQDGIEPGAVEEVRTSLLATMSDAMQALYEADPALERHLSGREQVHLVSLVIQPDGAIQEGPERVAAEASDLDIENAFRAASFILGPDLGEGWNRRRFQPEAPMLAKREFLLLTQNGPLRTQISASAQQAFIDLLTRHRTAILALPEDRCALYTDLQRTGRGVQDAWLTPEARIRIRVDEDGVPYADHLFVDRGTGACLLSLNTWESPVLASARQEAGYLGFLRNLPRKRWALSIAYRMLGSWEPMYPDFLVFREHNGRVLVDILEPHRGEDSVAKLKGMASFAERYGHAFGRIQMIRLVDGQLRRLSVEQPAVRATVAQIQSHEDLMAAFMAA